VPRLAGIFRPRQDPIGWELLPLMTARLNLAPNAAAAIFPGRNHWLPTVWRKFRRQRRAPKGRPGRTRPSRSRRASDSFPG